MSDEPQSPSEQPTSDLIAERRAKLERMREAGIDPFPHTFPDRDEIAAVRAAHEELEPGAETDDRRRVAGRLTAKRGHGKASFLDVRDGSGAIQIQARLDELGDAYEDLMSLDLGDIVGIEGIVFASKRGELSVRAESWQLLAKSLRPPPEKFHGLEDTETRYRKRELDLIANEETRERFAARAKAISSVRRWLDEHDFVEVETPVLQPLYGGALARPFTTHHNALDRDLYLRIATELYLKRLIVGGIDRVYELGKDFRNEGISHKHNPEFTMLEWYEAYADYEDTARALEELVSTVAHEVLGTTKVERDGETIDFAPPWKRITLRDAIRDESGIDVAEHPTREELAKAMDSKADEKEGWGKLVDGLLSKEVEPKLIQPTFIVDYPVELSPFAKAHRETEGLVERWEAFVGGVEIANSFTELNDPDEQRRRFEQQAEESERGDEEAQPYDEAFIEALEVGMPPTGGVGLGIDRLVMILTGAPSLREVVLFPRDADLTPVSIEIRPQSDADRDAVWAILEAVVRAGDTFMNDPDSGQEKVLATWEGPATHNCVAELDGDIVGAYLLRPTQPGLGSHIANASFAVAPSGRGHGVGRAMGEHALAEAKRLGFRAMQFNAVVSTNEPAIALWRSLGFEEVGRIPEAFRLGEGYVDTLVMHRAL